LALTRIFDCVVFSPRHPNDVNGEAEQMRYMSEPDDHVFLVPLGSFGTDGSRWGRIARFSQQSFVCNVIIRFIVYTRSVRHSDSPGYSKDQIACFARNDHGWETR
jgi:hypothetical protein